MLNSLVCMAKRIKLGLVWKVFAVYVIVSSLVSIYYVYYAMPKIRAHLYPGREREESGRGGGGSGRAELLSLS